MHEFGKTLTTAGIVCMAATALCMGITHGEGYPETAAMFAKWLGYSTLATAAGGTIAYTSRPRYQTA